MALRKLSKADDSGQDQLLSKIPRGDSALLLLQSAEAYIYSIVTVGAYRDTKIVSRAMRRVRGKNTSVEMILRRELWHHGLRYRLHSKKLPGKPDLVFARAKVAVFVDGDFWHGRQWQNRGFQSLSAQMERLHAPDYWIPKITKTIERDQRINEALDRLGWRVFRVWESDVRRDRQTVAGKLEALIRGERTTPTGHSA